MQDKFLIFGISSGGLFLARQLRMAYPDAKIFAIGDPTKDMGRYSSVIDKFFSAITSDEIYTATIQAHNEMGKENIKAFMCANSMLEFIVLQHQELFSLFDFENSFQIYDLIVDKTKVEQLCKKLGILRPEEYGLIDIENNQQVRYPVVIKPLDKASTLGAGKCTFVNKAAELITYLEKIESLNIKRNHLVCQQCVEGDNRWEYGYGGYFENGKPLIDIYFHQFQQSPQGLCCYAREISDESLKQQINNLVAPFFTEIPYTGIIEFDIKQDMKSKHLYLLDINPRPWRSTDMLSVKLGKSSVFRPNPTGRNVEWILPCYSLYFGHNSLNPSKKLCKQITGNEKYKSHICMICKGDMKPFLHHVFGEINKTITYYYKRARNKFKQL